MKRSDDDYYAAGELPPIFKKANKVPAECQLQSKCFVDHWNYYPKERGRFATITNNSENAIKGAINKAMGVLEGVSDTFYLKPNGLIIWIEFKKERTGKQSEAQKKWQSVCEELGHHYVIVDNYNDFWKTIGLRNPNDIPKLF